MQWEAPIKHILLAVAASSAPPLTYLQWPCTSIAPPPQPDAAAPVAQVVEEHNRLVKRTYPVQVSAASLLPVVAAAAV